MKRVLLYGIARQKLTLPSGRVLDLRVEDTWRELVRSIRTHVPLTRPPLYREHDDEGPALGYVQEAMPVTREQLMRAGVLGDTLPHEEYIMFRAALNERGKVQLALGDIARTSIGLAFDVTDDQGRVWPYFLDELSAVDKPHVRTQPTADELSRVSLRAGRGDAIRLSGVLLTRRKTMDDAAKKELLMQLASVLGVNLGDYEDKEEAAEETADEVLDQLADEHDDEEEMAADDKEKDEMSALRADVAQLRAKLQKAEQIAAATKLSARVDKAGVKLSAEDRKRLIRIGLADEEGFDTALRLAAGGVRSTRIAAGGAPEEAPVTLQDAVNRRLRKSKEG